MVVKCKHKTCVFYEFCMVVDIETALNEVSDMTVSEDVDGWVGPDCCPLMIWGV